MYDGALLTAQVVHNLMMKLRDKGVINTKEVVEILERSKQEVEEKEQEAAGVK